MNKTIDYARLVELKFDNEVTETAYGEPQIWIELKSGRSIEITHEQEGLSEEDKFYSIRLHCSADKLD